MRKKVWGKLAAVLFLVLMCSMTAWGAVQKDTDYTYQAYYGSPGHRGENAAGHVYTNRDGELQAFYREGEKKQATDIWLGMDVSYQGQPQGSYWFYFGKFNFVPDRWAEVDGKWYYQTRQGAIGGWEKIDGQYYYFDPEERYMWTSGNVERDGQMYTIGKDGIARTASELGYSGNVAAGGGNTGWAEDGGQWYFLRDGKRICSEWLQDGTAWYYLGADGYIYKGIREVDGTVYKFANDGHMVTDDSGFYNNLKYQFGADGKGTLVEMTTQEKIYHSNVVKWMKGTYAIYTMDTSAGQMMGANYDVKELLVRDWGIENRDGGVETVEQLVQMAGSASDKDQIAWHYSRAMMLCEALQAAEYITEEERYGKQLEIAPAIQNHFTSWDDFNTHYMNGFREWAYSVSRGEIIRRREGMYEYLKKRSDNPFLLDWKLELKKDW